MRSFVVEVSPTIADDGSTATYLFGTQAWATKPTDTPANTVVRPLLKNAGTVRRELFSGARITGAITPSYGNIVLANPAPEEGAAGDLDDWLGYGISGSKVVVRWGEIGDAYPSAWTTVYIAYAHSMVADVETITIRLRDRLQMLDQPVVVNGFAGTGGLEGNGNVSQKKQEVFGSPWFIAPILVDANRQIYFVQATTANVSGTFLAGVSDWEFAVFDMGVRIENDAGQQYTSAADIVSTSPTAGYVRFYFGAPSLYGGPALDHPGYPGRRTGGVYFRLGSPPAGDVRVWAFGEPTDDDHARRGTVLRSWFAGTFAMRAGIDIADIEADTLTGFHRVVNDDISYLDLLSDCALAANGWFGFTRLDKFRSGYLLDPESNNTYYNCPASIQPASATTSLYEFDGSQVKTLRREPVSGMDVPIWKVSFTVGQTFPSDVANGADPEIRDYLTREPAFTSFQGVSTRTLTSDPGAGTAQVDIRGMFATTQQAARLMAQRYLALYGGRRDFWTFSVPMADDVLALELHDVVTLKSPRFGLAAGRKHRIVGITIDCAAPVPQMRFVLWGGQAGLWTASTGGPGTPGYVRPGGGTDPGITAAARNSLGDFAGYMAGSVVQAPSSMFGSIGDFAGQIIASVSQNGYVPSEYVIAWISAEESAVFPNEWSRTGATGTGTSIALDTSIYKCGAGSIRAAGTGVGDWAFLKLLTSTKSIQPRTGDFCFEAWLYPKATKEGYLCAHFNTGYSGVAGVLVGTTSDLRVGAGHIGVGNIINGTSQLPLNEWTHVAVYRVSGIWAVAINGTIEATVSNSADLNATGPVEFLGADVAPRADRAFVGNADELRYCVGYSPYSTSSNFTPPTCLPS